MYQTDDRAREQDQRARSQIALLESFSFARSTAVRCSNEYLHTGMMPDDSQRAFGFQAKSSSNWSTHATTSSDFIGSDPKEPANGVGIR